MGCREALEDGRPPEVGELVLAVMARLRFAGGRGWKTRMRDGGCVLGLVGLEAWLGGWVEFFYLLSIHFPFLNG